MSHPSNAGKEAFFATTRWSVVLTARDATTRNASAALETLCRIYWRPLYGYARRRGCSPHDAEDATQGFFATLLEKEYLQDVQRELGPFRAFLQMAFKRYLTKERERQHAQRRGGSAIHVSFDFIDAENRYTEDASGLPADELFERRWAMTILENVMRSLRADSCTAGKESEFNVLKSALSAPKDGIDYPQMAADLQSSEGAVRVAVHRLRKQFRKRFHEEVSHTVAQSEDVDEEVRHLVSVLARS